MTLRLSFLFPGIILDSIYIQFASFSVNYVLILAINVSKYYCAVREDSIMLGGKCKGLRSSTDSKPSLVKLTALSHSVIVF
jgi:hypothetical protein